MILAFTTDLASQRHYVVSARADLVSGGGSGSAEPVFFATYPSIQMTSRAAHSALDLSYSFGLNRADYDSDSHIASARFSTSSRQWSLSLSESFEMTSDFTTFNALRGVEPTSDGFRFLFEPVVARSSSMTNSASAYVGRVLNQRSTLSASGSYSRRNYDDNPIFNGSLSDQSRVSANVSYSRKLSPRSDVGLGYGVTHYDFKEFGKAASHAFNVVYSHRFSPTLTLQSVVAPSRVNIQGHRTRGLGYNASVSLYKILKSNTFSFNYWRNNGESSGEGYISETQQVGLGVARRLGRRTGTSGNVSVFYTRPKVEDVSGMRGISAAVAVGIALNRAVSLNLGGQYQRYDQTSVFAFEQKRLFFSLRFNAPELWRFSR